MRLIHTADVHLRDGEDERWHALTAVLGVVEKERADVLVISGDLFDRDVDSHHLKPRLRALFERSSALVAIIPGNHDDKGLRGGDFLGENVTVIPDPADAIDLEGVRIVGIPYVDTGVEATLACLRAAAAHRSPDACNVLLFHGELLDHIPTVAAFGEEGGRDYMPVRLSWFDGLGFDYVLAGHFHRGFTVHRYAGGYFVYPGSPVSITRKESGLRHVACVEPGQPPRPIALDTHHLVNVEIKLSPFDDEHPADVIDRELQALAPRASAVVNVTGFANLARVGMTEMEFHSMIKQTLARYPVAYSEERWHDVGSAVEHELFTRFERKLASTTFSPERKEAVRTLVLDALMETIHAR